MANVPLMFQPLTKYAEFNGRSRRSEFWLWVLFRYIVAALTGAVVLIMLGSAFQLAESNPQQFFARYMTVAPIFQLVNLALLLPSLAVGVRRLHDTNRSGWWIAMPFVVTMIGFIAFLIVGGTTLFEIIGMQNTGKEITEAQGLSYFLRFMGTLLLCVMLPALISSIVMLVFYVTDGTPGPNRFGADPKGRGNAAVF